MTKAPWAALGIVSWTSILTAQQPASGAGLIQGAVVDSTGRNAGGIRVEVRRLTRPTQTRAAVTGIDGKYSFANLPAGAYQICAVDSKGEFMNPCEWSAPRISSLTASAMTDTQRIVLKKGVQIEVWVDDPKGLLGKRSPNGRTAEVFAGVSAGNGLFHPMRERSRDANGRTFVGTVASDTPVRLGVKSGEVRLADSNGKQFHDDNSDTFSHSAAAGPKRITLTITGPR